MSLSTAPRPTAGRPASNRRDPVQERSQETVSRVLAAAGRLLGRGVAVEALTTAQIAGEAGLSVGALYRFFPDKQAIVDAIALRHMEVFQEGLAGRIMQDFPGTPADFLASVVDAFAGYLLENPDFRTVAYGAPGGSRAISRPLLEAQAGSGEIAGMVRDFLSTMFGVAVDGDFLFRLRIATEIGDRLIAHAMAQPDAPARARVLDEAKQIIGGYLFPAEG